MVLQRFRRAIRRLKVRNVSAKRTAEISESKNKRPQQKIAVTLLLRGGHERLVQLDATDPSLPKLFETVAERNDERIMARVFNLETKNAGGSLFFAASDLIALSTVPAISLRSDVEFSYVIKENYLGGESLAALLRFVDEHATEFEPSTVHGGNPEARKSLVLYDVGGFCDMIRERIKSDLPAVLAKLQIPEFPISEIECQITAHNDGHYFLLHRDSSPADPSRIVTFVYYFNNEPRRFEGGSLRLYRGRAENGNYTCGEAMVDLAPTNDSMLFFPSACFHEVMPIKCASGELRDSRFTINGWIRTGERRRQTG